mgnify:CR=1 FL=1
MVNTTFTTVILSGLSHLWSVFLLQALHHAPTTGFGWTLHKDFGNKVWVLLQLSTVIESTHKC